MRRKQEFRIEHNNNKHARKVTVCVAVKTSRKQAQSRKSAQERVRGGRQEGSEKSQLVIKTVRGDIESYICMTVRRSHAWQVSERATTTGQAGKRAALKKRATNDAHSKICSAA